MKKGLVMEGGAMKGLFTAGVIDVLMENGIEFDGAAGTSAGATFGINYKSRQIGRALRYNKRYVNDRRYASFYSFITTGSFYNVEFCYDTLPKKLDIWDVDTFLKNPMEFFTVSTNMNTGKAHYHRCVDGWDRDIEYIRASASVPLACAQVNIDGYELLDGGIADSIPLTYMEHLGYDRNVVIETKPKDYRKKPAIAQSLLVAIKYHKYPNFVNAFRTRYIRYNKRKELIIEKEAKGEILVIRPQEDLKIGGMGKNPENLQRVYDLGRTEGLRRLEEVKAFLNVDEK